MFYLVWFFVKKLSLNLVNLNLLAILLNTNLLINIYCHFKFSLFIEKYNVVWQDNRAITSFNNLFFKMSDEQSTKVTFSWNWLFRLTTKDQNNITIIFIAWNTSWLLTYINLPTTVKESKYVKIFIFKKTSEIIFKWEGITI